MKGSKKKADRGGEATTDPSEKGQPGSIITSGEGTGPEQDSIDAIQLLQYGVIALVILLVVGYVLRNILHII